jgi:GTP1/Obg family GTP-binding protein
MDKKEKIIITINPVDNSIMEYLNEWTKLINQDKEKERIEQLRKERKAKIKSIFKNI